MARKVLEVFLSSTAQDLASHREAVYERLRRIEFFHCVRQEDFGAQDSDAVDFCRKKAQAANLFIGLVGMRRGWEPDGDNARRSITEMEHDWAKEAARRRFVYVSPDTFPVPGNVRESAAEHKRLLAFRARIMGERIVSQKGFESPELLASEIVERLLAYVVASDLIGELHPELVRKDASLIEEQRPAITAAVERLAEDQDVDLLALAKNPKHVDLTDLEAKLRARAEAQEARGKVALKSSAEYWRHIGALAYLYDTQKALAAYEKAVALDPLDPEGWRYLGELQFRLGNLDTAEQMQRKALTLNEELRSKEGVARIHANLGFIHQIRGNLDLAEQMQQKAFALWEELDQRGGMASVYTHLGNIHQARGDLDGAEEMQQKALKLYEEVGSKDGMAAAFGNLGNIHQIRGGFDKAEAMYLESLEVQEELGRKEDVARTYGNLGVVHQNRGDLDKAEEMQRKALTLNEELRHKQGIAQVYTNLAVIYHKRGDLDQAEEMQIKALALSEELGRKEGIARAYCNLGLFHYDRGDLGRADKMQRKALSLFEELGDKEGMAHTYFNLGIIYLVRDDSGQARQMCHKGLALYEALRSKNGVASVYGLLGFTYLGEGDKSTACDCWRKARDLYRETGSPEKAAEPEKWLKINDC